MSLDEPWKRNKCGLKHHLVRIRGINTIPPQPNMDNPYRTLKAAMPCTAHDMHEVHASALLEQHAHSAIQRHLQATAQQHHAPTHSDSVWVRDPLSPSPQ